MDDISFNLERFHKSMKALLKEYDMKMSQVKFFAFASSESDSLEEMCKKTGFTFYIKSS
jgi:3-oxoacyl-[acyl-carrier-protein] synthase III